jgi:hypothetical protein
VNSASVVTLRGGGGVAVWQDANMAINRIRIEYLPNLVRGFMMNVPLNRCLLQMKMGEPPSLQESARPAIATFRLAFIRGGS